MTIDEESMGIRDLFSLNERVLTAIRDMLREDFQRTVALLRINNLRLARELSTLTVGDISKLVEACGPFCALRLDESMAFEMLVTRVKDTDADLDILRMAAAATSEPAIAVGAAA